MPKLVLYIVIFFSFTSYSNTVLDSLLKVNQSELNDSLRIGLNINISRTYFAEGEKDSSAYYAAKALSLSQSIGNDILKAKSLLFLGISIEDELIDSAIVCYKNSSEILFANKHPWAVYPMDNLIRIYSNKALYPEALDYALRQVEYFDYHSDTVRKIYYLQRVGFTYDRIGDYHEAIIWYRKAIELAEKLGNESIRGEMLGYIGIAYDELGLYDSAHFYNFTALHTYQKYKDTIGEKIWCSNIANTYSKQKNWVKAEEFLLRSLKNESYTISQNTIKLINLAKVYIETNKLNKVIALLSQAEKNAKEYGQLKFLSETYLRMYEYFLKMNQCNDALENYIHYSEMEDSLLNEEKSEQVANLQIKFNTEQKEKLLLQEVNEKQRIEKEKLNVDLQLAFRNNILGLLIVLIVFITFASVLFFQRNKRIHIEEQNKAILKEKDKGLKAVIDAQEVERERIARELHDGIGQRMSSMKLMLSAMEQNTFSLELNKVIEILDESAEDVRGLSHQMMPRALNTLGLVPALNDLIESVNSEKTLFEFDVFNTQERYAEQVEVAIYRITQEILSNSLKHAEASRVSVQLFENRGQLILMVEDDGKGFDAEKNYNGIGLNNIRTRVELIKGNFFVESVVNQGTRMTIKIPILN